MNEVDVAIVGAGPYGLATAAHSTGLDSVVFGQPMSTWRRMQPDMQLRAVWDKMTLDAPAGRGTMPEWMAETGAVRKDPMTPPDFIAYGDWFRQKYVPVHIDADVSAVAESGGRLHVTSSAGEWLARALVVAVGITPFPVRPAFADVDDDRISPAADRDRFDDFADSHVVVVGGGQSAVEASAYAIRAGAQVTLMSRSGLHWFAERKPSPKSRFRTRLYRLAYPEQGVGPPPINRLVAHPDLLRLLPGGIRDRITGRIMRSGASPWLQRQVKGKVTIREGVEIQAVEPTASALELRLSDGSTLAADRLLLGTGYRFALDRLGFLDPGLRSRIATRNSSPVLDRWFRSTDPRILFVGYPAEGTFGPLCRFVRGAPFTAPRVAEGLRAALRDAA
jgi:lysine/ornithine N-monooxygenase